MASAFGTPSHDFQKHGGSFRAEDLSMTFSTGAAGSASAGAGGGGGEGALVQQVNFTLTRQIQTLYEIGSANVYYVGNRRQGQAQLNRIVGGTADFAAMITNYGNMCTPKDVTLTAGASTCGTGQKGVTYLLKSATLTSIGASVTAQEVVITESLGFMFLDLDYTAT